ncbi:hypothetical protein MINTM005_13790 [Mycobacterium intracellulare]|uniref:endonuclease domain-containing protein n=1 Tax=Mycobacterium intracellulare TaxID=1767 RepID=UPI00193778E6|nr:hypothetical protein MINTM005_13790 [Mycobacterium intracellulare]
MDIIPRYVGVTRVRDELGRKQCRKCGNWLGESNFGKDRQASDGFSRLCKRCAAVWRCSWLHKCDVQAMLEAQLGRCAVCGQAMLDDWVVDHDHSCCPGERSCGKCVRALLCRGCNCGLGNFKDSPDSLRAAADYIVNYSLAREVVRN